MCASLPLRGGWKTEEDGEGGRGLGGGAGEGERARVRLALCPVVTAGPVGVVSGGGVSGSRRSRSLQ